MASTFTSREPSSRWVMALVLVLMVMLVITTGCGCSQVSEEIKGQSQNTREKAANAEKEGKEASESWTDWATEKISQKLGLKQDQAKETANQAADSASETAQKSKETAEKAASG